MGYNGVNYRATHLKELPSVGFKVHVLVHPTAADLAIRSVGTNDDLSISINTRMVV